MMNVRVRKAFIDKLSLKSNCRNIHNIIPISIKISIIKFSKCIIHHLNAIDYIGIWITSQDGIKNMFILSYMDRLNCISDFFGDRIFVLE